VARDDLAVSASRVLAVVSRRGRSHGDDEAARRVGGSVEADGGEGAAAQGGFGAVEEEARGRRMRPGHVVVDAP